MKSKMLKRTNALLIIILCALGFSSCEQPLVKYGVPASFQNPPAEEIQDLQENE